MVVKVYISGISGNKEVKKRQQRVLMILDSKNIGYSTLDITEPGKESDKEFMQQNSKTRESKHPLPPQIFNEEEYCGDYEDFDTANEMDELEKFLRVPMSESAAARIENGHVANGNTSSREASTEKESGDQQVPQSHEELERIEDHLLIENDGNTLDKFGQPVEDDEKMDEDPKPAENESEEAEEDVDEVEQPNEKDDDSDEPEGEE